MSHFERSGPPDIADTYSLLVLNITFRTTADDLFPLFDKYGKVVDIFIHKDRRNGDSRGFAFARYKYADEASKTVERLDGRVVDGREITIQFAKYGPNAERIKEGSLNRRQSQEAAVLAEGTEMTITKIGIIEEEVEVEVMTDMNVIVLAGNIETLGVEPGAVALSKGRGRVCYDDERRSSSRSRSVSPARRSPSPQKSHSPPKASPPRGESPVRRSRDRLSPSPVRRSRDGRSPSPVRRSRDGRSPSSVRRSRDGRSPSSVRRSHDGRSPSSVRRSRDDRSPSTVRRSRDVRSPNPVKQIRDVQSPSPVRRSRDGRSPSPRSVSPPGRPVADSRSPS